MPARRQPAVGRAVIGPGPLALVFVTVLVAAAWGSTLIDAGNLGHMGSAAQLGVWPFGLLCFGQFLASLDAA